MKPNPKWKSEGQFYPDAVVCHMNGHRVRRRVLCFARFVMGGRAVVGASAKFDHEEAYENAKLAAYGLLPIPHTSRIEDTLTVALKLRGFPVSSPEFELSDRTAACLEGEFSR